jgi:hypothetical protein
MFHKSDSTADLINEWRWLVGGSVRLLGWASSGDLFDVDAKGVVTRVDTGSGELERCALSIGEFYLGLEDRERAESLLLLPVVREFKAHHGQLRPGECLGFATLPVFGGRYSVENRRRLTVTEHASFTGDVHRQIRDLPDGEQVSIKVIP